MKQRIRIQNHPKTARIYKPVANICELIEHMLEHDERTAFLWNGKTSKEPDGSMTYREFAEETLSVAAGIDALGLSGKRIAIIGASSHMWLSAYMGTLASDSVAVPMDKELATEAIFGFLASIDAAAIFYGASVASAIEQVAEKADFMTHFISMQSLTEKAQQDNRFYSFEQVRNLGTKNRENGYTLPPITDTRKLAEMLFTSGTTGSSKCVMLCQENIFSVVTSACETVDFCQNDTLLSVLPLHHTYELACMMALLNYGATCAINDSLSHVLSNLKKYKPTGLIVVPLYVNTFYKRIMTEAKKNKKERTLRYGMKASNALLAFGIDVRKKLFHSVTEAFGGRLQKIICGGAALNPSLIHVFESFGISIYEGFGITECSSLTNVTPDYARKPGSVGPAVPACTVRIAKNGQLTEDGYAEGEIQVKGKNVMLGYYNNEEATREAFTEDGWFRTGDIGYMDEDKYLYITGRLKSVIVLDNGKNVFPEEIEEYLEKIEEIGECVVVGRKAEDGTTKLVALIYPTADFSANNSHEKMKAYFECEISKINHSVPTFKQISSVELRDKEFEKTTTRKIKRHLIR